MSLPSVEAMVRHPLKRLRPHPAGSDGNGSELPLDSLKMQKCSSLDEEIENLNPVGSNFMPSKKFRALEQEIKPDTPVVPSMKSRLHRLAEKRKAWDSDELSADAQVSSGIKNGPVSPETTKSWKDELTRPPIKQVRKTGERAIISSNMKTTMISSGVAVQSVREKFEEMNYEKQNQEIRNCHKITAVTPSTKALQAMLLQKSTPSASRVIRMKKEREQELAMLQGKTDENNPWVGKKISRACTRREQTIGDINPSVPSLSMQQEVSKGSTEEENNIQGNDATSGFEHEEKYEKILRITEGDCNGEEPVDWSTPLKAVTFALEPQTIPSPEYVETESNEKCISEMELESSSPEELNDSEIIDELFEGVLDCADEEIELEAKDQIVAELEKSETEEQIDEVPSEAEAKEQGDDELTYPSMSVLSPLAKSIKLDAVAPLTTALSSLNNSLSESCCSVYSSLELDTPGQNQDPAGNLALAVESTPLYSIDLYRTQRRSARQQDRKNKEGNKTNAQRAAESSWLAAQQVPTKEKIKILNGEINRLHSIMHQASQALNCCTDEEHGKGSREEAEAERHLLIASERRTALLSELKGLKEEGNAISRGETTQLTNGLEPCRGTVSISDLRLPLKAEFVCSALCKQGKPSHYFLLMIRYGPHNIVATPLATAEDAQHGDTITFPTIITLCDSHYKFEIDVEVYSLAQTANVTTSEKRKVSRSKVMTPKKLLTSITKSSLQSPAASPAAGNAVHTSKFVLVGSHKITLASLAKDKFPLDKMKFDGKVRQLLGDEFQDKVPFLSPLEGAIYLKLQCHFHSIAEHSGFLTIFEDVSGFGAWHRRWFVLSGNTLSYWTYPNEEKHEKPIGCINLANCTKDKIEPASREFCSRPKTFELITARPECKEDRETLIVQCRNKLCFTKNWLSADTIEERNLWMEKLTQVLINLRTWQLPLHSSVTKDGI